MSAESAPSSAAPALFPREPRRVGKFDFLMRLGQGGMATVYLARTVSTGGFQRLVAIKLMHQFLGADGQFVEMFLDEARVAANIRHPNIVSIVDLGTDGEHLFMVMDYVEGDTLAAVEGTAARLGRAIPLGVVLRIILDSLAGLDAAHELKTPDGVDLKVVHRDVSPQNILVGVDGAARLTDFGIARAEQRIATTRTGMLKGKAPFMAPEQFEGKPVDRRADVFAMGVTLWEAVALRRLYPGRESYEQAVRNARAPYRKLKEILPSVPDSLDAIVRKALAPNPADRYPTAAAFADALEAEFRPILASHRQVGAFMAAVAAEKIQRERDAVRKAPKPDENAGRPPTRPQRSTAFGLRRPDEPIAHAAAKAFDSRPPERLPTIPPEPPANDIAQDEDDDDAEVEAALLALQEMPEEGAEIAELPAPARARTSDEDLPSVARDNTPTRNVGLPTARRARSSTLAGPTPVQTGARKSTPPRLRSTVQGVDNTPFRGVAKARAAIPAKADELDLQPPKRRRAPSMAGPRAMLVAPADPAEPPSLDLAPVTPVPPAPGARPSLRPVGEPLGESTIEFDLVSRQPRKVGDAVKPTSPASAAASKLERVRTDARSLNTDARKLVPDTSLTRVVTNPDVTVPAKRQPSPVARFPSLVPSKPSSLLQNRWIAGSVLAAVIFVVCFVLARGL
jgi:eukaryotic-like serine/threonine-protein kinase